MPLAAFLLTAILCPCNVFFRCQWGAEILISEAGQFGRNMLNSAWIAYSATWGQTSIWETEREGGIIWLTNIIKEQQVFRMVFFLVGDVPTPSGISLS